MGREINGMIPVSPKVLNIFDPIDDSDIIMVTQDGDYMITSDNDVMITEDSP